MTPTSRSPACCGGALPISCCRRFASEARFGFFSSQALLEELADVLTRPAVTKQLAAIGKTPREVLTDFVEVVELVEPTNVPSVVTTDPYDDQVIAAAVAAQAELVISGDRDLLVLRAYQEIAIVSPAEALTRVIAA